MTGKDACPTIILLSLQNLCDTVTKIITDSMVIYNATFRVEKKYVCIQKRVFEHPFENIF